MQGNYRAPFKLQGVLPDAANFRPLSAMGIQGNFAAPLFWHFAEPIGAVMVMTSDAAAAPVAVSPQGKFDGQVLDGSSGRCWDHQCGVALRGSIVDDMPVASGPEPT